MGRLEMPRDDRGHPAGGLLSFRAWVGGLVVRCVEKPEGIDKPVF